MAVATTLSILSVVFPPLQILASAANIADTLIATYKDSKAASEYELAVIKEGVKQYLRFKDDMEEFKGCADSVNKLLAERELDTEEVLKYKHSLDKVYAKWSEQVQAMKDITDAQSARLAERGSKTLAGMAKRGLALGSGQVKKVAEQEDAKITRIKGEAQGFKVELSQKAGDFINRLTGSPMAVSGKPGGFWGGGGGSSPRKSAAAGAFEKEYAVLTGASGSASPAERIRRGLAAAAAACRGAGTPAQAYLSLEAVVRSAVPDYNAADDAATLRLAESSMADAVAVLQAHGTSNASIAEKAWQVVHAALEAPQEEDFDSVAAKWGRAGLLAAAADGLAHMAAPANASAWGDCVDDLCTALGRLCQGGSAARELLGACPGAPELLAAVVRDNAVDPDVYRGALAALAALFERSERHPEEPGSVFALARALFPGGEGGSGSSGGGGGGGGGAGASPAPPQRPLLCVALIKVLRSRRVGGADCEVFALCNAVLAASALPGLAWLGPRFLEWEDLEGHSVLSEALAYVQGQARAFVQANGAAAAAAAEEEGSDEEEEEEEEGEEDEEEDEEEEEEDGERFPLEVCPEALELGLAGRMLTFLHYLLTGADLEQRIERRVVLSPEATARYLAAALTRDSSGGAACVNLLLCAVTDVPLYHRHWYIEGVVAPALAFLLALARGRGAAGGARGKLAALPGAMAAFCAAHPQMLAERVRYIAQETEEGRAGRGVGPLALRVLAELEAAPLAPPPAAAAPAAAQQAQRPAEPAQAPPGAGGCCSVA